jgi:hypothetical protein
MAGRRRNRVSVAKVRKKGSVRPGELIRKLRKPLAPPTRVAQDERKYSRARERERVRREAVPEPGDANKPT